MGVTRGSSRWWVQEHDHHAPGRYIGVRPVTMMVAITYCSGINSTAATPLRHGVVTGRMSWYVLGECHNRAESRTPASCLYECRLVSSTVPYVIRPGFGLSPNGGAVSIRRCVFGADPVGGWWQTHGQRHRRRSFLRHVRALRSPIAIPMSVWIRAAPPLVWLSCACIGYSLLDLIVCDDDLDFDRHGITWVCPACVRIVSRRTATSLAWVSGASSTISSCTLATIRAPVSFKAASNCPSACFRMSASVPCTGIFKRSVRGGCLDHRGRRPLRVLDSYTRRCLTFACEDDTPRYALKNCSPKASACASVSHGLLLQLGDQRRWPQRHRWTHVAAGQQGRRKGLCAPWCHRRRSATESRRPLRVRCGRRVAEWWVCACGPPPTSEFRVWRTMASSAGRDPAAMSLTLNTW